MNTFLKTTFVSGALLISQTVFAGTGSFDKEIAQIRYNVTAIEHTQTDKIAAFDKLIQETDALVQKYPTRAEPYVWEGIALSAKAKHQGISALSSVKKAKVLLEKSITINPSASDGAGYNALAMLYYKVPAWPIAFGNNAKAESYFQKALATSSNLDTNYRYGEFLIEEKNDTKDGLKYLEKAMAFPDRPGRKEDALKKDEVKILINKTKEEK